MGEPKRFFVGGKWKESGNIKKIVNPYNNKIVAEVCFASKNDLKKAVEVANEAFETTKKQLPCERSMVLQNTAKGIEKERNELANIIVRETGKPIKLALAEVDRAAKTFIIAATEAEREILRCGENLKLMSEESAIIKRFPIGVILGISPFNFPLNLVAHKIAPCIASGNTIILKPSSQAPTVALKLGEILESAGIAPGQINILPCESALIEPMIENIRIKKLTFTGSADVGWHLKKEAHAKMRVTLELGGNAAAVVHNDADLNMVVPKLVFSAFAFAGQVCIHTQRIYVHESIFDEFVGRFVKETQKNAEFGNPENPKVIGSCLIDKKSYEKARLYFSEAIKKGAKSATQKIRHDSRHNLIYPIVLTNTDTRMAVHREENFAPIVCINHYRNFDEALAGVNDSKYGLQAGVFTQNKILQSLALENLDVGAVIFNDSPAFRVDDMPYGGIKDSGFGREGVKYAIEKMTELKLAIFKKTE